MAEVLVLYYSRRAPPRSSPARCAGASRRPGASARLRTVPPVAGSERSPGAAGTGERRALCHPRGPARSHGLVLGSPTRFGNMAAPLKYFLDGTASLWLSGALAGKPAGVFTSTQTMHGGQETTLLSMMLPLLHHGMLLVGLPYTERALNETRSGGTPYGASHVGGGGRAAVLTEAEKTLAQALGRRVAPLAVQLSHA